ncbi:MAG TPA: oxygenase MpaB family protein [Thermomonospora sp.]|nr:oxygenase MpaB family protein [Thermomonospora sp.]
MEELGPGSLLWRYAGDRRYRLVMPRIAALRILHPAIAAAGEEHSRFPGDLWRQMALAAPRTISTVYDGPAFGRRIGATLHAEIKGTDDLGRRYHALTPEVFHWEHAAFVDGLFTMIELFDHPMTGAERERLYAECRVWYRMYGISDRVVPPDWASFRRYHADMCAHGLRLTPSALRLRGQLFRPHGKGLHLMPEWVVRGMLPPRVRELLEVPWGFADDLRFQVYARGVRRFHRTLPNHLRYVWPARRAFAAAGARLP